MEPTTTHTPDAPHPQGGRRVLSCVLALALASSLLRYGYDGVFRALVGPQHDFAAYYAAARAIRVGADPYDAAALRRVMGRPDLSAYGMAYGLYPPFLAICLIPLTALSFEAASIVWFCANHLWAIACVAVLPLAFRRGPKWAVWLAGGWIMLNLWPVAFTLDVGNANLLLLLVLTLAFCAHAAGRCWVSGGLIAVGAMIKLHPALFIPYALWTRQYRLLVAICLGCCIIAALCVAGVGMGVHRSWLDGLGAFVGLAPEDAASRPSTRLPEDDSIVHPANQSIAAFWSRLFTRNEHTQAWAHRPKLAHGLTLGVCLALWLATMAACKRGRATVDVRRLEFGAMVALAVVASTQSWEHHYALLFIPFCAVLGHVVESRRRWPLIGLLAVSYALIAMEYEYHHTAFERGILIPVMSIKLLAGVLLLALLIGMVCTAKKSPA